MYQNIVTDKPQTYSRYLVIGEYETLEEAEKNYKSDVRKWTDENKGTMAYKLSYPFGFATIKGNWTMVSWKEMEEKFYDKRTENWIM